MRIKNLPFVLTLSLGCTSVLAAEYNTKSLNALGNSRQVEHPSAFANTIGSMRRQAHITMKNKAELEEITQKQKILGLSDLSASSNPASLPDAPSLSAEEEAKAVDLYRKTMSRLEAYTPTPNFENRLSRLVSKNLELEPAEQPVGPFWGQYPEDSIKPEPALTVTYEKMPSVRKDESRKLDVSSKASPETSVRAQADKEAKAQAKLAQEAKIKAEKEAQAKMEAEKKALAQADKEAKAQAKLAQEAKIKAEKDAQAKIEAEKKALAQADKEAKAQAKLAQEAKIKAEKEAQAKIEAEKKALAQADKEAKTQAKLAEEAKIKAEKEAQAKIEAEKKAQAYQQAKTEEASGDAWSRLKAIQEADAKKAQEAKLEAQKKADPIPPRRGQKNMPENLALDSVILLDKTLESTNESDSRVISLTTQPLSKAPLIKAIKSDNPEPKQVSPVLPNEHHRRHKDSMLKGSSPIKALVL